MELSSEDSLRLNVLLAQNLHAVRIDESKMCVMALTDKGEATVSLNPTGRDEQYVRQIKELLSSHVLGSPGGYPVYLKRWTRMGQTRDENLKELLLLGEPEAVVAVVHASGLTPELARLAWWAMPEAENARRMLEHPQVAGSEMGRELAQYLVEFLPFETEPKAIIDTVRLTLQPGLVSPEVKESLWQKAGRKGSFYIGFLQACPYDLPETTPPHPQWESLNRQLAELRAANNPYAQMLCQALSAEGQAFLQTVQKAMDKLQDQDSSVALFRVIGDYFQNVKPDAACQDSEAALAQAQACLEQNQSPELQTLLEQFPAQQERLIALLTLAQASEALLDSFFSHSNTVGALMRRKLAPWTEPMLQQLAVLSGD
jgi:hypothetical protein